MFFFFVDKLCNSIMQMQVEMHGRFLQQVVNLCGNFVLWVVFFLMTNTFSAYLQRRWASSRSRASFLSRKVNWILSQNDVSVSIHLKNRIYRKWAAYFSLHSLHPQWTGPAGLCAVLMNTTWRCATTVFSWELSYRLWYALLNFLQLNFVLPFFKRHFSNIIQSVHLYTCFALNYWLCYDV